MHVDIYKFKKMHWYHLNAVIKPVKC